ncbi:MAG: hypothetical protein NTV20_02025, partial [Candidatus Shapirobacteria bacterium]|nr:hypothetical protein [Candidatus Shapirobacteria bacterium]
KKLFTIKGMKNLGKFILALSFLFFIASPATAVGTQTATPGATTGLKKNVSQEVSQVKEKIQERVATIEARLGARKKEIIRNYFTVMTRRLEAAINRLNRLITRIDSRIAKIEANNKDINTEPIKKDIQKAKDKLLLAPNKLNEAKIKIDGLLESNTPKESFAEVRDIIKEIKQDLIDIHQILVKVIGDIKGLRVGTTSTPSATIE